MQHKEKYQRKDITRAVFRAYDIRGIIGLELDEDSFYTIGRALALYLRQLQRQEVYLGWDGRLTSNALSRALKEGLLASGIHVITLGEVPTPVVYYATHTTLVDCGLMVTGSHNPAEYNGIKMVLAGKTLAQEDINFLYTLIGREVESSMRGEESSFNILPHYKERIVADVKLDRALKVVVDCGNGVAGPIIPDVLEALGCEVIPLYCDVDGRFPNHHPDPTVEANLSALKETVFQHSADLGLAFDGDADRLGLVTNKGEMICPDRLMMLFAQNILERLTDAAIVFDVKCSSHLEKVITAAGGRAIMCPTGHSIVKAVMKETGAALAGEMSGHLFFKDRWYGFDDALYSACRLLEIISKSTHTVDEQFKLIPNSINTPEIKIIIAEEDKFAFMKHFCEQADFPEAKVLKIDGLRVEFTQGWGLLRASNTTPCLVARFEAECEDSLRDIQQRFKHQIHKVNQGLVVPF